MSAHPFAPGAIEHHTAPQRRSLVRWLKRSAALMLGTVAVAFVAGLATGARAGELPSPLIPTTVGLHLHSVHLGDQARTWNNANRGAYLRWGNGLTVGTLRNSLGRQGTYVAWTLDHPLTERLTLSLTAGVTSGYDRLVQDNYTGQPGKGQHTDVRCNSASHCRTVLLRPVLVPLLAPSVAWHITPQLAARVSFIAKTGPDADHALHLSTEWSF